MEALSQRMHDLEQDNASLRGDVDCRNAEIVRLRQVIRSMCGFGTPRISNSETPALQPSGLSAQVEVRVAASCPEYPYSVLCASISGRPCKTWGLQ